MTCSRVAVENGARSRGGQRAAVAATRPQDAVVKVSESRKKSGNKAAPHIKTDKKVSKAGSTAACGLAQADIEAGITTGHRPGMLMPRSHRRITKVLPGKTQETGSLKSWMTPKSHKMVPLSNSPILPCHCNRPFCHKHLTLLGGQTTATAA